MASRDRRGFSIVELMVGVLLLAIIGMALTKIMLAQARYFDHQKTANLARNVSRGPLNRVVSDLRMVEATGGITAASSSSITVRVPYAIGAVCAKNSGYTHISLLPVDSAMYAAPGISGYAWRKGNGEYTYMTNTATPLAGDATVCSNAGIQTLTASNAKIIKITPVLSDTASVATPVFLYRRIKYEFKASTTIPGSTGLFRTVLETGSSEELSAPYASDAKFKFFVGSSTTAVSSPPSDLSTLRGIELNMSGLSESKPRGGLEVQKAPFTTAVFFKNRLN
jgi:prepilin-type N-terminal cleavage/methylation domain-containing protein